LHQPIVHSAGQMRRGRAIEGAVLAALIGFAVASAVGVSAAKPGDEPKPQPKPKLELLTASQQEALAKRSIKVAVSSKRGSQVRGEATLVVDGFPDDFTFKLGPESKPLKRRQAKLRFPLSSRKREVLAFAAQACDKATLAVEARAARTIGTLDATLSSEGC
jgi:hypothetical protein